eukprot:TRINITY_DN8893_c0_g1_i1.p1 TRINITY_DN8893_c0_g1~~TRINITY_DN8893_c0_g1_i1.p1  ORF type:complete len:504 (-),score=69.07 TRINITY_DN8893_c0_g1_i1:6-1487(-)
MWMDKELRGLVRRQSFSELVEVNDEFSAGIDAHLTFYSNRTEEFFGFDFQITFSLIKTCPGVKCFGQCVENATLCGQVYAAYVQCPSEAPFGCQNSGCQTAFSQCMIGGCAEGLHLCWDGSCVISEQDCPPLPGCVFPNKKCGTECIPADQNCTTTNICNGFACPDGSCRPSLDQCAPFNGCLGQRILCPNGVCATNISECGCANGTYQCFDRSCVSNYTDCPLPPYRQKPAEISYQFPSKNETSTKNETSVPVWNTDFSQQICQVLIPDNVFGDQPVLESDMVLTISPRPDSYLSQMTYSRWNNDSVAVLNLYTPVVDIDFPLVRQKLGNVTFARQVTIKCRLTIPDGVKPESICSGSTGSKEWKCNQDYEIVTEGNITYGLMKTFHFTNFALIFGGQDTTPTRTSDTGLPETGIITGGKTSTDDEEGNKGPTAQEIKPWLIAVIVIAIVAVLTAFGVISFFLYKRKKRVRNLLTNRSRQNTTAEMKDFSSH